jgi:hypothetical protein
MAGISLIARLFIVASCMWLCSNVPRKQAGVAMVAAGAQRCR